MSEKDSAKDQDGDITQLLIAARDGNKEAFDRLLPMVYDEMRRAAHLQLRRHRPGQTLNTTALVNEAYLKLVEQDQAWRDRNHFMAVAATAMRHILVDAIRRRTAQKRGGPEGAETFNETRVGAEGRAIEILALDRALESLAELNERLVRLVELRFFGGLTVEETAEVMGTSERTVKRDWRKAKAFLYQALEGATEDTTGAEAAN